jgi:predicted lipoprotein with Yx(FWY)xxD motif
MFLAVVAFLLALAGCGDDESGQATEQPAAETAMSAEETAETQTDEAMEKDEPSGEDAMRPKGEEGLRVAATRAQIVAKESDFGRVLFDANGQVVYVFEIDSANQSNCTSSECVTAWPPVLTKEEPTAGDGVDGELLGTTRRDDGSLQVTYDGRPLYFYEHEGPGEVKCHNVNLHGGLWWVVTPAGDPAA